MPPPTSEATRLRAIGLRSRVIVVGSVNVDLVVRVDRLPEPGETVTGGTFARHHGGKGANQAVAAARLGAPTTFVGALGDDGFGKAAREALRDDEVDIRFLATLPEVATGVALILVDASGENAIAVASGANGAVTETLVDAAFQRIRPGSGDVVLLSHEIPTATVAAALRGARAAGATTVLNPAPVGDLDDPTLRLADVITPNRGELAALTGGDGDAATLALALRDRIGGEAAVLVSMGRDGAILVGADVEAGAAADAVHRSVVLEVTAVDAVGAGDTLNGALAAGLAEGLGLRAATDRAVIAASLAVTRAGARGGMPTLAEILTARRPPD